MAKIPNYAQFVKSLDTGSQTLKLYPPCELDCDDSKLQNVHTLLPNSKDIIGFLQTA